MSKGGLLCWLLVLEVCIAQQSLISISQLTAGGQIGDDDLLFQDPIRLMSIHGRDELGGHSADSIFDDWVDTGDEYASINRGVPVAGGRVGDEEEEGLRPPYGDDDGGDSGGTKGSSGSGGVDVECPECGKFFKNDKSMFGHLRSHPNRGYKGAIPPVKKLKQSPGTTAAASASSSSQGTDRTPAQRSSRDPQLTPLEILCAYVLLTLKYRGHTTQQVPQPPSSSFGKLDAIGQAEGGTEGSVSRNAAAELKCNAGAEARKLENCDEHGYSILKISKKRRNMPKDVREAHRKKARLVPTLKEKRPYACKHCKAEFPTNQALGGHVAGHHREKKLPSRLNDPSAVTTVSQNGKHQVKDGDDDDDKNLSLRRGLLSEQFSMALDVPWQSGHQASGGKMRHHYERRNGDLSMAVAAPTPTPIDDGGAGRPWNIDLNVEAPEQE
ncbi:hypothetical protein SETIT_7G055900v2 [Setaria italica]|uniref:C2H2-type domain-containing protein n=1 Tax=Setaria italica TaxID=4555 RepID=K3YE91_SETIT|nr:hypothetical protein SETIT_7G055900v2 [Setaria italica]